MDDRVAWWWIVLTVVLIATASLGLACVMIHGYDCIARWWYKRNLPERFKDQPMGDSNERSDNGHA